MNSVLSNLRMVWAAGVLLAGALSLHAPAAPGEAPPPTGTLEHLVGQWIQLRRQIASETEDWSEKKERWQREIELLESERAGLRKELDAYASRSSSLERESRDLVQREEALDASLQRLEPLLDRTEARLRAWGRRIPPSLGGTAHSLLDRMPDGSPDDAAMPVTSRLQLAAALLTEIETLQHQLHLTREVLPVEEDLKREVEVLYLGLDVAYAVSSDQTWAAVGTPVEDGWSWIGRPDIAGAIRRAMEVLNRERPAGLVTLPVPAAGETSRSAWSHTREEAAAP